MSFPAFRLGCAYLEHLAEGTPLSDIFACAKINDPPNEFSVSESNQKESLCSGRKGDGARYPAPQLWP